MTNQNYPAGKTGKIIYWIATPWLALGMVSTGIVQLIKMEEEVAKLHSWVIPVICCPCSVRLKC
jgi:hypothetical protein